MILGNEAIENLLKQNVLSVEPLEDWQIQPASIDLTLAKEMLIPQYDGYYDFKEEIEYDKTNVSGFLSPGQFVLASTREYVKIPKHLCGIVYGRSSIGRVGLIVETAGWIDPGFEGNITLELMNCTNKPLQLHEGMGICQLVLTEASGSTKGYGDKPNKYQGQKGTTGSLIYEEV